jgi:hypothetical protein
MVETEFKIDHIIRLKKDAICMRVTTAIILAQTLNKQY